jgi:alkaline phosphatase D
VRIYRSLDWGNLARIVLLDTRLIGRDRQLNYATQLMPRLAQGENPAAAIADFRANVLEDPHRTMMGAAQEAWFAQALGGSKRRGQPWQIITQQVVMSDVYAPPGISGLLSPNAAPYVRQYVAAGEQLGALHLPFNLDAWSGYPAARARFLAACKAHANNAVVLGGDSHNFWAAGHGDAGRLSAIEFAGGSVTSPGFEHELTNAQPGQRESMVAAANPQLATCDLTNKGYGVLKFTPTSCSAEWVGFTSVAQATAPTPTLLRLESAASANSGPGAWNVTT